MSYEHTPSEAWLPSFPGENQPGHGVSHSPPSSVEVNDEWSYTSIPPIRLHGVDRNITFTSMFRKEMPPLHY